MNTFKATLDTRHQNGVIGPITQFDNATLELQILSDGQVIEPWDSPEFELIAMKRDMNPVREVDQDKFIILSKEDHKVRIELKEQFLTCRGTVKMQLVVKDGGRTSTTIFYLSIGQSLDAAIVDSIKDIKVLDDLDQVVESLSTLNATAEVNEVKRQENEKLREIAESNRQGEFEQAQNQRDVEFNEKMEEYQEYVSGLEGIQGKPGETPQIQVNDTHIQIKYPSQQEWTDLIALERLRGLQGLQGETLQIQVNDTHIQFKYPSQREWSDLVALDKLKGPQGIQGKDGVNGQDGITPNFTIGTVTTLEPGQEVTVTIRGDKENPILDIAIPRGADGKDGQGGGSGVDIDDSTISTNKTWSSSKIEDFVLTNDEVVWTDVNGENGSINYTKEGYLREIEVWGNTIQDEEDLSNIQHLGELYVDDEGEPILDDLGRQQYKVEIVTSETLNLLPTKCELMPQPRVKVKLEAGATYTIFTRTNTRFRLLYFGTSNNTHINNMNYWARVELPHDSSGTIFTFTVEESWLKNADYLYITNTWLNGNLSTEELFRSTKARMFKGTVDLYSNTQDHRAFTYEEIYVNPKLSKTTLLLPCQLMKVGDVSDRLYWDSKKGKYVIESKVAKVMYTNYQDKWMDFSINDSEVCIASNGSSFNNAFGKVLDLNNKKMISCELLPKTNTYSRIYLYMSKEMLLQKGYEFSYSGARKYLIDSNVVLYLPLKYTELLDTEIREELKLPTFINRTYVSVNGGIAGSIKTKAPINGGQAILSLSQKNTLLEQENAEIKAINQAQDTEIALNQDAINFMLFAPTVKSFNEEKGEVNAMAAYLTNQILKGRLGYTLVVSRYEEFKEDIDTILIAEGKQDLIK